MIESFTRNKNYRIFCFLWIVLSISFLQAQEKKTIAAIEKIYLHTDRSTYFIGEDLWYKAYAVRAYNNFLFDNSNILYVELIASDSKIIARNKTNLELGLGYGDFQLLDSLEVKPGRYQLRAYTNWNRNFGDDFVFKKDIEIINVYQPGSAPNPAKKNDNTEVINAFTSGAKNMSKVDFFPEGGSLLENVASIVGFKAVDSSGKPIDVTGEVFDSNNELITSFVSSHDGMGKFQIIPIEGKQYYAKIKTKAGVELRSELPKVTKLGYLLNYRLFKGKNIITINTNSETLAQNPNGVLTVVCKARGISYLESNQTLIETSLSFELPKDKIPEGISQITLFDSNNKPQSERLVYIEKEHDLEVSLATDKTSYIPEEKVSITVSSKSKTGVPKSASFSLSVTDMNGEEEDKDLGTNISSYFLMESDIRGKVNNPAYYFNSKNLKRLEDLDNLLLTQGWREFLWKTTPIINESVDYVAEKGITIKGKVKQLLGSKPLVNTNLTLGLMNKKNFNIFNAVTDSIGRFKFENLMFSGKTKMYLSTRNAKGKFRGEIVLRRIENPAIPVTFKSESIDFPETTNQSIENVFKKFLAFGGKPDNFLKEVKITSKKKFDSTSMIGIPEFTYVADTSAANFVDIYQLIENVIPGTTVELTEGDFPRLTVRFFRYKHPPVFVIDGFREGLDRLDFVLPSEVLKIEAIREPQSGQYYGSKSGVIAITTNGNKRKPKVFHTIYNELEGFYTARVFYVPDPSKPNPELDDNAAVRNTIYWTPYLNPDKTGNASVSYFNSSVETKVKVVLEGMTASGIPVVKKMYYTIKK
ncbi:hypothetical protein [Flavobacterium sp. WC2509]|uniref:hypothetical protein n=1 Tax=Flavobacterium sp. WC2509 TaxID=3461406 RepID=UPI004043E189